MYATETPPRYRANRTSKAFIIVRSPTCIEIVTPNDMDYLDAFSRAIDPRCRQYEPESRSWIVTRPCIERASKLVSSHFGTVEFLYDTAPASDIASTNGHSNTHSHNAYAERGASDDYATLCVTRNASPELIRAAFRVRSKETHPDMHPYDPDAATKFKAVKSAYDRLTNATS